MIKNYFKTAWRSLWKNKSYSFLNIVGLATGIACAALIFLWVENEVKYDHFNAKRDRLYFTRMNSVLDAGILTHWSTPGVIGPAIQTEIPGVENTCRTTEGDTRLLFRIGDRSVYASGKYTELSLFSMFSLPFVQGNAKTAFSQLYSLVITEKTAEKFFGTEKNVIGKTIRVDNKQDYVVTGILKDIPENSSLQFEWLAPFEIYYQQSPWAREWRNSCVNTYVELKPGADLVSVNKQLYNIIQKRVPGSTSHPFLFGMNNWHLFGQFENGKQTGGGQIQYVRLFSAIAWIILFIACINFMNLSTARSEKRAKEVGVRKVLGAGKKKLIGQFIGESLLMSLIAAAVAVVIMSIALPSFNDLVQKRLLLNWAEPLHISALLIITLVCGLLAGSYPSLYLSSFNPVFVLKGVKLKTGSASFIRKGLVVLQFSISIILIISTIIIYQQIQHVKTRDLGFNKNNLIEMPLQGNMLKNIDVIKHDLINTGAIENVALADHETIYAGNNTTDMTWPGKDPNSQILVSQRLVSPEFVRVSDMKMIEGRDFHITDEVEVSDDFKLKDSNAVFNVIVTQSMAKILGRGSAISKTMQLPSGNGQTLHLNVIGVVKDYVYGDMYEKPNPVVLYCLPKFTSIMYVRTKPQGSIAQTLAAMARVMKKDNPAYPFEYRFVDDQFNEMFLNEMLIGKLSRVFAALAIIISCLGLFGLAAYTAERRTREIGIRKVLGASVTGITGLLSKDFLRLVFISTVIAFPLSWWFMHKWLQSYAYRISINWWVFVVAGVLALLIALITISFQSIKAAITNPVKNLRTE
ncbi:MAG TPA: ABC transporter permease [Chitinophagaceae bacterium]|nr:ABC transporter permease [Chitinophagaceae bacterium]